jgi:hypothetical protein
MRKALLLFAAIAVGQALAQGPASVLLRLKPRTDKPYTYVTHITSSGGSTDMSMKMDAKYEFASNGADKFKLKTTITDFTAEGAAAGMLDSIKGTVMNMDLSNRAELLNMSGNGKFASLMSMSNAGGGLNGIAFPVDAVTVGQTWQTTVDLAKSNDQLKALLGNTDKKVTTTNKVTKIDGNFVTIETTSNMTLDVAATGGTVEVSTDVFSDVDTRDGLLVKLRGDTNMKLSGSVSMDMTQHLEIKRQ